MNDISVNELKQWMEAEKRFILIDVREVFERADCNIGGLHIPMGEVMARKDEFRHDIPVVVYCQKGIRSGLVIQRLHELGFSNLYNLTGGITAWKRL